MRVLVLSHCPRILPIGGAQRVVDRFPACLEPFADVEFVPLGEFTGDVGNADVIHATDWEVPGIHRAFASGLPVIATVHGAPRGMSAYGWSTGRRGLYRVGQLGIYGWEFLRSDIAFTRAAAIHCVSEKSAEDVRWQAPWVRDKVFTVHPSVNTNRFTPTGKDEGYVLFVGRVEHSKGIREAVRALTRLGLPFKVAGSGSIEAEVRKGAGPNVEFLGAVSEDELLRLYQNASFCLFPSHYEGFGLVAIEALACGTPVILSDGFPITGPANDFFSRVPIGDEAAIAREVERIWKNPVKSPEWSRRAAAAMRDHYSERVMGERLVRKYEEILSTR